ncbi:MAG TPA: chemotaxis protein [Cyanobacteria bacterium UBA11049]|nr:chemotaxis protein [Cyanobacteria bacterium UBA11049]
MDHSQEEYTHSDAITQANLAQPNHQEDLFVLLESGFADTDAALLPNFNDNGTNGRTKSVEAKNNLDIEQAAAALMAIKTELKKTGALKNPELRENMLQIAHLLQTVQEQVEDRISPTLQNQRRQLAAIATQMRRGTNLEALLGVVVKATREALHADRVLVYRFDTASSGKVVAEFQQRGWRPTMGETLAAICFGAEQQQDYAKQPIVAITDINRSALTPYQRQLWEQFQVKASLSFPILVSGQVWGLLVVQQCSKPRSWQEAEINLLYQISQELRLNLQQSDFSLKLKQQAEQEKAVSKVIARIRQAVDTNLIFKTTTQEVRQLLKADRVAVYRFNPDWSGEFVAESVGAGWLSLLQEQDKDVSLKGDLTGFDRCTVKNLAAPSTAVDADTYLKETKGGDYTRGKRFKRVDNIYTAGFSHCYIETLEKYQARAYVIVPIFQDAKLWGLLAAYQNSGPRHWEDFEVNLLLQLSTPLSIAQQQTEVRTRLLLNAEQITKAAERERTFARIIEKMRQSLDISSIFQTTTQEIRQFLKADRIAIHRFNPDWSLEFVAESVGSNWVKLTDSNTTKVWKDTYLQETQGGRFRHNETMAVDDIYAGGHSQCHTDLLEKIEVKAYAIAPVFRGKKLWGFIAAYQNSEPRHWEEWEVNLLGQSGNQLGLALQQAESLIQIQQQAEREKTLAKVIDRISQSHDVNSIFTTVTQELQQLLKADRVAVYRFNPDWTGDFVAESMTSGWVKLVGTDVGTNVKDTHLQETEGGRYRRNESLVVDDIYNAGHAPCHVEILERFQAKAYILVPIFAGPQLWGLLCAYQNATSRHWQEAEASLLKQIGVQLGIPLQRAETLEQLRTQSEELAKAAARDKAAKEQLQQQVIQLLAAVRPVFSGDLTVRVPITEDEVGTIADAYNNTIQSLRKIVMQVQTAAVKVAQTSRSSEGSVVDLAEQARQQSQELTRALRQIQVVVSSNQAVATNAQQVEAAVQQANQTVRAGDTAMNRTVDGIMQIRETVSETTKKIKRLSESSQKISKVVNLIGNFTTQTQLLALNAAIEATRAGAYGKGFAVVADEVRSLARQSAEATTEIEKLVQEIQAETSAVSMAMDTGIQQVVSGTSLVNETRQSLNAIVLATTQISELVQGITQTTLDQTQQSQTVIQVMTDVAANANQTAADSVQISDSFQELLATAEQLQSSVGRFKVN